MLLVYLCKNNFFAKIMPNQDPEQIARDKIDSALWRSGWVIQDKDKINLNACLPNRQASLGVVVRYYLIQSR
jgi:type I site-specific restriction endonuclease